MYRITVPKHIGTNGGVKMRKVLLGTLLCGFLAGTLVTLVLSESNKVEAAQVEAQSPQRFQIQSDVTLDANGFNRFYVVCDTMTGILVYTTSRGGVWGVPNGCHKNPR